MKRTKTLRAVALALISATCVTALAGCSGTGNSSAASGSGSSASQGSKTVKIAYVNWSDGIAITNLAAAILEDKLGCKVDLTLADVAPVYTSIASGSSDLFLDAWLPKTQESYMDKYGAKIDDFGAVYEDAKIGLVVPSYVDIDSIDELNGEAAKFSSQIVGIDSGAGIMNATDKAIKDYGLKFTLMSGSDPTMCAALKKAIDAKQSIVITGWTPHWMFARYDLKFLKDPKGVYGSSEQIRKLTRKDYAKDNPKVANFVKKYQLSEAQLSEIMANIEDNQSKDPKDVARDWMKKNESVVNGWLS